MATKPELTDKEKRQVISGFAHNVAGKKLDLLLQFMRTICQKLDGDSGVSDQNFEEVLDAFFANIKKV